MTPRIGSLMRLRDLLLNDRPLALVQICKCAKVLTLVRSKQFVAKMCILLGCYQEETRHIRLR